MPNKGWSRFARRRAISDQPPPDLLVQRQTIKGLTICLAFGVHCQPGTPVSHRPGGGAKIDATGMHPGGLPTGRNSPEHRRIA